MAMIYKKLKHNSQFICVVLSFIVLLIGAGVIIVNYLDITYDKQALDVQSEFNAILSRLQLSDDAIHSRTYEIYLKDIKKLNDKKEVYKMCKDISKVSPYVKYVYIEYRPYFFEGTHLFCPCYDVKKRQFVDIADSTSANFNYPKEDELYRKAIETDGAEFHTCSNYSPYYKENATRISFFVKDSHSGVINAFINVILDASYTRDICKSVRGWQPSDNIAVFYLDTGDFLHTTFNVSQNKYNFYSYLNLKNSDAPVFIEKQRKIFQSQKDTACAFYRDENYLYSAISDNKLGIGMSCQTGHKQSLLSIGSLIAIIATFVISVVLVIVITALMMHRMLKSRIMEERSKKELDSAAELQKSMLPKPFGDFPQLGISTCLVPAHNVGGDLIYYFRRANYVFFCIGDVSGKGMPASLFMSKTISLFASIARYSFSASDIAEQLNFELCQNNDSSMFVTMFIGVINLDNGEMQYCNAGHEEPLYWDGLDSDKPYYLHTSENIPLGVEEDMPFTQSTMYLKAGSRLLLYTDGVTEAKKKTLEMYGVDRLLRCVTAHLADDAEHDMCETIVSDIRQFVAGNEQSDDITILSLRIKNIDRTIELSNDISELKRLPEFFDNIAKVLIWQKEKLMNMRIAIDEALTNCIRYAYPSGEHGEVSLRTYTADGHLIFVITDEGVAFNPLEYKGQSLDDVHDIDIDDLKIGGLGIPLIKNSFDHIDYQRQDEKNILTLKKDLN